MNMETDDNSKVGEVSRPNVRTEGRHLPTYVYRKGRAGYLYFVRGSVCIRMPDDCASPGFKARYRNLMADFAADKKRHQAQMSDADRIPIPARKDVNRMFRYDSDTGRLHWWNDGTKADRPTSNNRYYGVNFMGKQWLSHRLIWKMFTGESAHVIDHIDGDGLNNRFDNLRAVDASLNMRNKALAPSKHGTHGVAKHGSRWKAHVGNIYLGLFTHKSDAIAAREAAEAALGYHANHGRET